MSPRSKLQNEEIRFRSKRKILDAAFKLIVKNGYESTSIAQIAKEANISKGLVYNYFESKEEILKSLVLSAFTESDQIVNEKMEEHHAGETLKGLIQWFFNELRTRSEFWKLITELAFKIEKYPFVLEIVKKKLEEYIELLSNLLAKTGTGNPAEEARSLAAVFDGMGFHYLIMKDEYPLDVMEKYLIDKYCNNQTPARNEK